MAKACVNMKPVNVGSVDAHLTRKKAYMAAIPEENRYTRRDLEDRNLVWSFVNSDIKASSVKEYHQQLCAFIKDNTGRSVGGLRKMQDPRTGRMKEYNSVTCMWDMYCAIKDDTSMEDMNKFIYAVQERFGLTPVTVAIHRDEGHYEPDGEWVPNLHAHIVWDRIRHHADGDKKAGTAIKLQKQDVSALQEMAADILGMEKGISKNITHRRHLERDEYIQQKQEEREKDQKEREKDIERLEDKVRQKTQEVVTISSEIKKKRKQAQSDALTAVGNKVASLFGKGDLAEKDKEIEKLKEQNKALTKKVTEVKVLAEEEWKKKLEEVQSSSDRKLYYTQKHYSEHFSSQERTIENLKEQIERQEHEMNTTGAFVQKLIGQISKLSEVIRNAINTIILFVKGGRDGHLTQQELENVRAGADKLAGRDGDNRAATITLFECASFQSQFNERETERAREELHHVLNGEERTRGMHR